jgi:hypothetical protein
MGQSENMTRILVSVLLILGGAIACSSAPTASNAPASSAPAAPTAATKAVSTTAAKSGFSEALYLFVNPDVKALIQQGKYKSGLEHYTQIGQTKPKANGEAYESFFTGTAGSDTVQSFGKGKAAHLSGVNIEIVDQKGAAMPLRPQSLGKGEVDVLVGTKEGGNEFLLGSFITPVNPKAEPFYVGGGDADYARVQNFDQGKDGVMLAGNPSDYTVQPKAGNVQIATKSGDLVAIVEGVDKLVVGEIAKEYGMFSLK